MTVAVPVALLDQLKDARRAAVPADPALEQAVDDLLDHIDPDVRPRLAAVPDPVPPGWHPTTGNF